MYTLCYLSFKIAHCARHMKQKDKHGVNKYVFYVFIIQTFVSVPVLEAITRIYMNITQVHVLSTAHTT